MKNKFSYLIIVFCLLIFSESAFSQKVAEEPVMVASDESGEIASSILDLMRNQLKQNNARIFVIARTGTGEGKRVSANRLRATKQHFFNSEINLKNFVFAQGESVKGEGRIEFYLGSELKLVLLAKKNRMPNLTCCDV